MAKTISPEAFAALDPETVTFVDLREPAELRLHSIPGAINLPLSQSFRGLENVSKDKPVVVVCSVGQWSDVIAEVLTDRGYDAVSLEGGFNRYLALEGY